jgi:Nanos RNA binding domain
VKDRNGKVTCPTLMHTECRNCKKKGHTIKYCLQVIQKPVVPPPVVKKPVYQSAEHERKVLFPPLSQATSQATAQVTPAKTWTTSFADTLLRETPKEVTKEVQGLAAGWTMLREDTPAMTAEEAVEWREFESRKRKCEDYLRSNRQVNEYEDEQRAEWQREYEDEYGVPDDDTVYFQEDVEIDTDFDDAW